MKIDLTTPREHVDARGRLSELLRVTSLGEPLRQVYAVTLTPGARRAGHFHTRKMEWLVVLSGDCDLELVTVPGSDQRTVRLSGAHWQVATIPPRVHHTIVNCGHEEAILLVGSSEEFDATDPDVHTLP